MKTQEEIYSEVNSGKKFDIVIVNWNGVNFCKNILSDLLIQKNNSNWINKIIVVDNNSIDGSVEYIIKNYPEVILISEPINHGYAKGNNIGIKYCSAEYVMLLNNDTRIIDEIIFDKINSAFLSDKNLSAISPRLILEDGSFQVGAAGYNRGLLSFVTYFLFLGNIFGPSVYPMYIDQKKMSNRKIYYVDWLCGAALTVRRDKLIEVGGIPEDFFMYAEDMKLCQRLKESGGLVGYITYASIMHFHGGTENKNGIKTRWITSTLDLYKKEHGSALAVVAKIIFALGFSLRAVIYFLTKNPKSYIMIKFMKCALNYK